MSFTALDIAVLIILLLGTLIGFKKGFINSIISFIGIIIAITLAWYLKNPISEFMYTQLPFFSFQTNASLINIIIYELIAFLVIAILLLMILKLIVTFTGLVEKILNLTIILGFASKILGMIVGFIETYIIVFISLFLLYNCTNFYKTIDDSSLSLRMLNSSPILTKTVSEESKSIKEITEIKDNFTLESDEYNEQLFEILIKYQIISSKTAKKLVENNKIKVNNAKEIIQKYETRSA